MWRSPIWCDRKSSARSACVGWLFSYRFVSVFRYWFLYWHSVPTVALCAAKSVRTFSDEDVGLFSCSALCTGLQFIQDLERDGFSFLELVLMCEIWLDKRPVSELSVHVLGRIGRRAPVTVRSPGDAIVIPLVQ